MRTAKMGPDHWSNPLASKLAARNINKVNFLKLNFSCNFVSISHDLKLAKNVKNSRENDPCGIYIINPRLGLKILYTMLKKLWNLLHIKLLILISLNGNGFSLQ